MRVYLVRHGKASKDPLIPTDAERPLTDRGRQDVQQIAELVARTAPEIAQIRHSGLVRAAQTAEIFGEVLQPPQGVIAVAGLHFDDPVHELARELALETEPVMLVGHNPFMENLASALLTCRIGQLPIYFTTSTTACLETVDDGWTVRWVLNREFARE